MHIEEMMILLMFPERKSIIMLMLQSTIENLMHNKVLCIELCAVGGTSKEIVQQI
jgi:hypothetical protein